MTKRIQRPEVPAKRDLPQLTESQRSGVAAAIAYLEAEYPNKFPSVEVVFDRERLLMAAGVQAAIAKLRQMLGKD